MEDIICEGEHDYILYQAYVFLVELEKPRFMW